MYWIAAVKVFLQPTAEHTQGIAQIKAIFSDPAQAVAGGGATRALILALCASSVPVLQLALSGKICPSKNSTTTNFIRTHSSQCPSVRALSLRRKQRQVQVDPTTALQSKGLSALDVVNASAYRNLDPATRTSRLVPGNTCFHSQRSIADDSGPESNPDQEIGGLRFISKMLQGTRWAFRHRRNTFE